MHTITIKVPEVRCSRCGATTSLPVQHLQRMMPNAPRAPHLESAPSAHDSDGMEWRVIGSTVPEGWEIPKPGELFCGPCAAGLKRTVADYIEGRASTVAVPVAPSPVATTAAPRQLAKPAPAPAPRHIINNAPAQSVRSTSSAMPLAPSRVSPTPNVVRHTSQPTPTVQNPVFAHTHKTIEPARPIAVSGRIEAPTVMFKPSNISTSAAPVQKVTLEPAHNSEKAQELPVTPIPSLASKP